MPQSKKAKEDPLLVECVRQVIGQVSKDKFKASTEAAIRRKFSELMSDKTLLEVIEKSNQAVDRIWREQDQPKPKPLEN
jgi:hypothetical protein